MSTRTRRQWIVDSVVFGLAVVFGLWLAVGRMRWWPSPEPAWLLDLDQVAGALGCAALWFRRRWPVPLAAALIALSSFSELVGGAAMVALFTVAVLRPPRVTALLFAGGLVAAFTYQELRPEPDAPASLMLLFGLVVQGAVVGWGLAIHHRRKLVVSLRERAVRATREEIAREMHDVLGHRLSLLSVHAGALEFRPDAPADEIARAAKVIRESSHQALQDLREVLGVLRAPVGDRPQPGIGDLDALLEESRQAGMRVELRRHLRGEPPDTLGRTAYRIVQESLTNARKHAPGAAVEVTVDGGPENGLTVEVTNSAAGRSSGSGQGLAGLTERAAIVGGRLTYGPEAAGEWRVSAWLPWPP
ncbi:sensor histidine kinase [Amycolatopsis magusensis]|uniref:histidine kinase n=1 Tax=Amycolatopsis magusensis TaxID=882444 RepID=A0ABS4PKA7_9PSEU|nr:histidine kinase [Amycolatopsis magusensis]MBP2179830.1 signal transduction histidine kinase [Amycolatopsis magusensis]